MIILKLSFCFLFSFFHLFYKYCSFIKILYFKLNYYNHNDITAFINIYIFNIDFNIIFFINYIYSLFNLIIIFITVIIIVIFVIIFKLKYFIFLIIKLQQV